MANTSEATLNQAVDSNTEAPAPPGHEGSGSPQATGKTLLGAWVVSILVHMVGLALMFAIVFPHASSEEAIVPEARIEILGDLQSIVFEPVKETEVVDPKPQEVPLEARYRPKAFDKPSALTTSAKPELPVIGIGSSGGDFAQYGLAVGSGSGPEFFGLGGQTRGARRIVYVVDRSGSMLDTFQHVRVELLRSINALRRSQKFHVIFFNAGPPLENPPRKLVSAINAQKTSLFEFLSKVHPSGSTDPARAMRRALSLEPDLVYFLTDGEFDAALLPKLDQWNRDRRVRIFTIAYFDVGGADLLERIAREHGGEFKFVTENDLP